MVNADAGTATNLKATNSEKLDGKSEADFYAAGSQVADSSHADSATTAQNASNADRLNDKESEEILPLLQAQRDELPNSTSFAQSTNDSVQMNTVSITAPTDGFFVIWSAVQIAPSSSTDTQKFTVYTRLDGTNVGGTRLEISSTSTGQGVSPHTTVPASVGEHTITLVAERFAGTGSWVHNRNNLTVMFVPQGRGSVTSVPFGG